MRLRWFKGAREGELSPLSLTSGCGDKHKPDIANQHRLFSLFLAKWATTALLCSHPCEVGDGDDVEMRHVAKTKKGTRYCGELGDDRPGPKS
jgi:hypothetical protein